MTTIPSVKTTIRKFKWFWPWQDQQEEEWLTELARTGVHLRSSDGFGYYTFELGAPAEMVYRMDYNYLHKKEKEQYLQLFIDAGWEYVGEMNAWHYFRKPVKAGQKAEIFSDNESKIKKYNRYLGETVAMVPIYLLPYFMLDLKDQPVVFGILMVLFLVVITLTTVVLVKVMQRINELKKL